MKRMIAFALAVCLVFGDALPSYAAAADNIQQTTTPSETVTPYETITPGETTTPDEIIVPEETVPSCGTITPDETPVVIPTAPAAPVLTELTAKDYQTVSLQWNAVPGADGYVIERAGGASSDYTTLVSLPASTRSYTDASGLWTGYTYTYRIYAFVSYQDASGENAQVKSSPSATRSIKLTYTTTPGSFRVSSARYDRIALTWKKAVGATGYEIYRSTKATTGFRKIATVSGSKVSYTDKKLTTGTTYYYRIRAIRTCEGVTTRSAFTTVKKTAPIPDTPVLKASYKNYATATLKWNRISGANGYTIYRSTKKGSGYKKIATIKRGSTITYTDTGLATGKTYYYKIKAFRTVKKDTVYGKASAVSSVKLTLKVPTSVSISAKDYRTLTVKWKKVSGADGYYIYRSTKANGTYKRVGSVKGGSILSYSNQGVTTGRKYYYKVKAYRIVGNQKVTSGFSDARAKSTSLKKVSGITATPLHANKIQLTWKKVTGATSYNIYRSATKNGTYKLIKKGVTGLTYTNSKLTNNSRYYYKITAIRGSYESGQSAYVSAKAASLDLSQTSVVVQKRFSVSVTATPSLGGTVMWSTSNPGVATVSSSGVIYGVGVGTATITVKANGITRTISVKVRQTLDGIDVSKWQGTIDFNAVKNAGYHFVMIRVYNGYSIDPNFETYYRDAIAAGLSVGVYYYSYATSVEAAVADASTVLSILNGRTLHYPVVIDMEDNTQLAGLTNQNRTDIAWAFCNTIAASGYQSGLYANTYWLDHYFENSQLANMNLWIARWTQDISIPHGYTGSGNIFMWQYTSDGSVPGISGRVDLNVGFSD